MTVRSHKAAVAAAMQTHVNKPGSCQWQVRTWFDAPSAGDRDHDGDADAVDGWLSEPARARHTDRNWPEGSPLAFSGGSKGYGHRALGLANGEVRSTDMDGTRYKAGVTSTTTIEAIERAMGVKYVGWSDTIDGLSIPDDPKPAPPPPPAPKKNRVTQSLDLLKSALVKAKKRGADKSRKDELRDAIKHHPKD